MAIKGKSRSRGARGVASGPKPTYVPVKTPLLRRRGFWIPVAVVLGVAAIAGLWYGFANEAREERERELQERMSRAISRYRAEVEPPLTTVGEPVPPASFDAFPVLGTTLDAIERGRDLEGSLTSAESVRDVAASAAVALEGIDVTAIVTDQGFDQLFVVRLLDSRDGMAEGLRLYEQAADLAALAAEAPEEGRDDLVSSARGVLEVAERVFADGYSGYVEAQAMASVLDPLGGGLPLPGPTGAGG